MGIDSGLPQILNEAKTRLPIDDQWDINNMWSQDQGQTVAKVILLGRATGISYVSYKK